MSGFDLPLRAGSVSRQAHADLPEGTFEREVGREGFSGPATHLYHRHPPTSWTGWDGPHRPRAFDLAQVSGSVDCPSNALPIAANAHLKFRLWKAQGDMRHLFRNADGDDLLFLHEGTGEFYCDYGHLRLVSGDYVLVPRGTLWRFDAREASTMLLLEATGGSYRLPDRGLLGEHALFDPAVLDVPALDDAFRAQQDEEPWTIRIKARGRMSVVHYPYNPLDAVGWKGTVLPVRLNWRDIRPVNSHRYHLPPSAHTTFVAERFAVCTFCPRPAETDPGALKVPFFHSNDDYDEILFLHAGKFFSRDGMGPGSMTFHPSGVPHGPHPGAYQASLENPRTHLQEVAINIDARDPLDLSNDIGQFERLGHVDSWRPLDVPA